MVDGVGLVGWGSVYDFVYYFVSGGIMYTVGFMTTKEIL